MRFTPSSNWNLIASAAHRTVITSIDIKKTTDISEALSAGTWVSVTQYMDVLPSFSQQIEYELGQFSSGSVTLSAGKGIFAGGVIQWFKNNIFNASASEYIELRASAVLKLGSLTTSDTFYPFSGFVDKTEVQYNELADSVTFNVYTADELGTRISAAKANTQYINPDVDGAGTDGLVLPRIRGIYITDANIASYVLQIGLHTIEYEYNAGTEQAKLDDGDWTTLPTSDDYLVLVNGQATQKIQIYVVVSELTAAISLQDYAIVTTAGNTLPQQPWYGITTKNMLTKLYEQNGLTTINYDTLQLNTKDGNENVSLIDVPPADAAIGGNRYAITSDGTDLWIAVDKYVYKRTMSDDTYEQLVTLSSGSIIKKLMYNARNNVLFIFYTNGSTAYLRRYRIGPDILDAATSISTTPDEVYSYAMELVDYNYTGASYEYSIIYAVDANGLKRFDCSSFAITQPAGFADTGVTYSGGAMFMFTKSSTAATSHKIWYARYSSGDSWNEYKEIELTTTNVWANNGRTITDIPEFLIASFDSVNSKIFTAVSTGGVQTSIAYHSTGSATSTDIVVLALDETCECIYSSNGKTLFSVIDPLNGNIGTFYSYSGTTRIRNIDSLLYSKYNSIVYSVDRFYGVDVVGNLWQYHTVLNMSFLNFTYANKTIKDAISSMLQGYNLIGTVSSHKKVFVYRRANDSGTIQNSGHSMPINVTNASDVTQVQKAVSKIQLIIISNGTISTSYDGTTFDSAVLNDARTLEITNESLPSHLLQDIAKYIFQFYNSDRDKYTFPVNAALNQYEVMDGADVTFSTTKISKTATGLITAQTINPDGSMEVEVLF